MVKKYMYTFHFILRRLHSAIWPEIYLDVPIIVLYLYPVAGSKLIWGIDFVYKFNPLVFRGKSGAITKRLKRDDKSSVTGNSFKLTRQIQWNNYNTKYLNYFINHYIVFSLIHYKTCEEILQKLLQSLIFRNLGFDFLEIRNIQEKFGKHWSNPSSNWNACEIFIVNVTLGFLGGMMIRVGPISKKEWYPKSKLIFSLEPLAKIFLV